MEIIRDIEENIKEFSKSIEDLKKFISNYKKQNLDKNSEIIIEDIDVSNFNLDNIHSNNKDDEFKINKDNESNKKQEFKLQTNNKNMNFSFNNNNDIVQNKFGMNESEDSTIQYKSSPNKIENITNALTKDDELEDSIKLFNEEDIFKKKLTNYDSQIKEDSTKKPPNYPIKEEISPSGIIKETSSIKEAPELTNKSVKVNGLRPITKNNIRERTVKRTSIFSQSTIIKKEKNRSNDEMDSNPIIEDHFEKTESNIPSMSIKKKLAYKSQILDAQCISDYENLEFFKYEINIATIGAAVLDVKEFGKIIYSNNQFTGKLFQERLDLIGSNIFSIISQKDKDLFVQNQNEIKNCKRTISETFNVNIQDKHYKLVNQEAFMSFKKIGNANLIILQISSSEEEHNQIIEPNSIIQIVWMIIIIICLVFISVQMPQDIVFDNSRLTDLVEIPLTIIFTMDIIINFNVAVEYEGKLSKNRSIIAYDYLVHWFFIDIISTMPYSIFMDSNNNPSFLKIVKILRLFRFFKLFRIMKLTRFSTSWIKKDEIAKTIQKFMKQNQGQFDLLKNMLYIYLFAHQYSVLFQLIEQNFICDNFQNCWLKHQFKEYEDPEISLQNYILFLNIKIALGLDNQDAHSNVEVYLAMTWMFLGLSLFGQGIGNISAQLSYTNKYDLEQLQTSSFFSELCFMHALDPRLQSMIMDNIDSQYSKQFDRELLQQSNVLPPHILDKIEINLYQSFISLIPLFEKLNIQSLRLLKHNYKIEQNQTLVRKDMTLKNMQFITKGKINVQDQNMNLINYFEKHELQGLEEFYEYIYHKYGVDIEKIMAQHVAFVDSRLKNYLKQKLMSKLNILPTTKKDKSFNKSSMKNQQIPEIKKNNLEDSNSLMNRFVSSFEEIGLEQKMFVGNHDNQLVSNQNVICSDESEYITVPIPIFEEIFFSDIDSFQYIYKYQNLQNREVNSGEWDDSDKFINEFNLSECPIALITPNQEIFDVNLKFSMQFSIEDRTIQDVDIRTLMHDSKMESYANIGYNIEQLFEEKMCQMVINNRSQKVVMNTSGVHKLVKQDRNSIHKNHQINLAKSLMTVQMIKFDSYD